MYRLQNLLKFSQPGVLSGAMSPFLAAQEAAKQMDFRIDGLCRVWFKDDRMHNWYESPGKRDLTGCDTLIIKQKYRNGNCYFMIIDAGSKCIPVGIMFSVDQEVTMTEIYQNYEFGLPQLTEDQLRSIFNEADKGFNLEPYNPFLPCKLASH